MVKLISNQMSRILIQNKNLNSQLNLVNLHFSCRGCRQSKKMIMPDLLQLFLSFTLLLMYTETSFKLFKNKNLIISKIKWIFIGNPGEFFKAELPIRNLFYILSGWFFF